MAGAALGALGRSLTQANRRQPFTAGHGFSERGAHPRDELLLIFRIPDPTGGEFGGTDLKVRPDEFRMLFDGLLGINRRVSQRLGGRRARLEEISLLHDPPVPMGLEVVLTDDLTVRIALGAFTFTAS